MTGQPAAIGREGGEKPLNTEYRMTNCTECIATTNCIEYKILNYIEYKATNCIEYRILDCNVKKYRVLYSKTLQNRALHNTFNRTIQPAAIGWESVGSVSGICYPSIWPDLLSHVTSIFYPATQLDKITVC